MSTSRICWWTANPESVSEVESVVGFAADSNKGYTSTGVRRGCGHFVSENVCKKYNNESIGGGEYLTGEICYCTTDLCNSAPQTSIGPTDPAITDEADRPMTVSFIGVVSLLGLTTARLLSE